MDSKNIPPSEGTDSVTDRIAASARPNPYVEQEHRKGELDDTEYIDQTNANLAGVQAAHAALDDGQSSSFESKNDHLPADRRDWRTNIASETEIKVGHAGLSEVRKTLDSFRKPR